MAIASYVTFLALLSISLALVSEPDFAGNAVRLRQLGADSLQKRNDVPAGYVAAPYYPTPKGGWVANWTAAYAKAQEVVRNMTLAEKVNLTTGTGMSVYSNPILEGNS